MPVGLGRPGNEADGIAPGGTAPGGRAPGGSAPGGSVPPSPTAGPVGVGVGDGEEDDLVLTLTVFEAETDLFLVSLEVSVAVSLMFVPADLLFGTTIRACNSVWLVLTPTEQLALPVAGHTVKRGENRCGLAASVTFTVALPLVTQTKIAYRACMPG